MSLAHTAGRSVRARVRNASRRVGLLAFAATFGFVAVAHADAGSFSWTRARGADACPSRARVADELTSSLGRPVETALEGRSLDATVERDETQWVVTLYWRSNDGTPLGTRVIREAGANCDGATRAAMASILVAIGADAIEPGGSASSSPPPSSPPPTASSSPAPSSPEPAPASPAPRANEPSSGPPPDAVHAGDVLLSGILSVGWLPVPAYGVQLIAEPLVWRRLRIGVIASTLAEVRVTLGSVSAGFTALEFGVDACGTLFQAASWVEFIVCGGARGGVVSSYIYGGAQGIGGAQPAVALEGTGLIRLTPVGPAVLEIGAIGRANLTQYNLTGMSGGPPFYSQSIGAFITTIRLGVHF